MNLSIFMCLSFLFHVRVSWGFFGFIFWLLLFVVFNRKKRGCYFRFRYRCSPSMLSASVKPASISIEASSALWAILQINSSAWSVNSAFSRLM